MGLKVDKEILFFSFRYALGRFTSAPSIVYENINNNFDDLNILDKKHILSEIEDYLRLNIDDPNLKIWITLKNKIKNDINND